MCEQEDGGYRNHLGLKRVESAKGWRRKLERVTKTQNGGEGGGKSEMRMTTNKESDTPQIEKANLTYADLNNSRGEQKNTRYYHYNKAKPHELSLTI